MKRDYLSYSALKAFAKSPNHYLQYVNREFVETPAMVLGSALHCAVLEPGMYAERYVIAPKFDRRTKAGKEQAEAWELATDGVTGITAEQDQAVQAMKHAIRSHSAAARLLNGTRCEVPVEGEIEGVQFKGVIDALGKSYAVDIKTTTDASPEAFRKQASNLDYHLQAVIYTHLTGKRFKWIAVESAPPYNAVVYEPTPDSMDAANAYLRNLIADFIAWDGRPVGYGENIYELELPPWHPAVKAWNNPSAPVLDNNDTEFNSFINSL
jgi:hypothetical protein